MAGDETSEVRATELKEKKRVDSLCDEGRRG